MWYCLYHLYFKKDFHQLILFFYFFYFFPFLPPFLFFPFFFLVTTHQIQQQQEHKRSRCRQHARRDTTVRAMDNGTNVLLASTAQTHSRGKTLNARVTALLDLIVLLVLRTSSNRHALPHQQVLVAMQTSQDHGTVLLDKIKSRLTLPLSTQHQRLHRMISVRAKQHARWMNFVRTGKEPEELFGVSLPHLSLVIGLHAHLMLVVQQHLLLQKETT